MGSDFPVPRAKLPRVHATPQEAAARKLQMQRLLSQAMGEYEYFREQERGVVDPRHWKLVSTREATRLYRERNVGSRKMPPSSISPTPMSTNEHSENDEDAEDFEINAEDYQAAGGGEYKRKLKSMRLVGELAGRMENGIVSVVTKSSEELALVHVFLHGDVADSRQLCTLEGPTAEDPLRYLGYKWLVKKSPGGRLIKNRDTVYLEYTGATRNKRGERIGYLLNESVDVQSFPEMPERNCVRSLQSVQFLMRQKSENVVEVFMTAVVEPSGNIPKLLTTMLTPDTLFAILKVMDLAEARRLTQMIIAQRPHRDSILYNRKSRPTSCALCYKRSKLFNLTTLLDCNVCAQVVCSRCRTHKHVFVGDGPLGHMQRVDCCKTCVIAANSPVVIEDAEAKQARELASYVDRMDLSHNATELSAYSRARSSSETSVSDSAVSMAYTVSTEDDVIGHQVSHSQRPQRKCDDVMEDKVDYAKATAAGRHRLDPAQRAIAATDRFHSQSASTEHMSPTFTMSEPGGAYDLRGKEPVAVPPFSGTQSAGVRSQPAANQADLYSQMLELRRLAEDTYYTTRQNHIIMEQGSRSQPRVPDRQQSAPIALPGTRRQWN